jgi:hypothetical protein
MKARDREKIIKELNKRYIKNITGINGTIALFIFVIIWTMALAIAFYVGSLIGLSWTP